MKRIALICPGRGTYTRSELGTLTDPARPDPRGVRRDLVARADVWRRSIERKTISGLDGMERFGALHLAGENAAALIFVGSAADAASLAPALEVVAVAGNSMGWYTALAVAGALEFDAGLRLVDTMGGLQRDGVVGGQVIVPVVDEEWRRDPVAEQAVDRALDTVLQSGLQAWNSIHLGGYRVLAGEQDAVRLLLQTLPRSKVGEREYPFQLLGHSAFHTPLMEPTSRQGGELLADLPWGAPRVPLIDGRGHVFDPRTSRPDELRGYTLGTQVVETFDFTAAIRVVLREFAPDALVLLGPGDTLGGAVAQILISEGWTGLRSKTAFQGRQRSDAPILFSMGRPEQFARVAAS